MTQVARLPVAKCSTASFCRTLLTNPVRAFIFRCEYFDYEL